jgi:hypothetical protein
VTTKRSLGISPFQLVYGNEATFPSHIALSVANFFQDYQEELDDMIKRIHHLVEVQQTREQMTDKAHDLQLRIKEDFERKIRK